MVAFIGKVIGVFFEYAIIFQKGYQEFDNVQGAITTKLKGVAETKNVSSSNSSRIWDVNDYVVPPQENLAFFVTTNLIVTDGQQMGVCDENQIVTTTPRPNPPALAIAEKFTVFIKNNIEFPKFGVKRFSRYYKDENGTDTRTLFKAYGIKFILTLQGRAGKFSIVPLVLNIGSGLALLSVATIICDIVVLYVLKSRALYKEKKYLEVVGDDAYEEMRDDSRAG
ncbi:P2RX4-like protein [Mya arenaria]|uniref:P2RX4-like protein n=1 Tax=Mya arenaria TaxID=6604 RepID=A0ABY7E454_MYAAR|nr:P2RX4-like protein [Mya arenaria]